MPYSYEKLATRIIGLANYAIWWAIKNGKITYHNHAVRGAGMLLRNISANDRLEQVGKATKIAKIGSRFVVRSSVSGEKCWAFIRSGDFAGTAGRQCV